MKKTTPKTPVNRSTTSRKKLSWAKRHPRLIQKWLPLTVIALIAAIGTYLLVFTHAASVTGPLVPADGHVMFGANQASFQSLQTLTGRKMETVRVFQGWGSDLGYVQGGTSFLSKTIDNGSKPILSLDAGGTSWQAIANGDYDSYLVTQRGKLRAIPMQFFFDFMHEPTLAADSTAGRTPASFVAAWKHIHDVFTCAGSFASTTCQPANNLVWTWIMVPNPGTTAYWSGWTTNASGWYPGDNVVDWIGLDPYLFECQEAAPGNDYTSNGKPLASTTTGSRLTASYKWATSTKTGRLDMPIMLAEWGTNRHSDTDDVGAGVWIAAARADLKNRPSIKNVNYFSSNGTSAVCNHLVDTTTPNMLKALTAMANDSYYGGAIAPSPTPTPVPSPTPDDPPVVTLQVSATTVTQGDQLMVTINATDTDTTPVSKVEIYDGTLLLATLPSGPYTFTWDTTNVASGSHTIVAKAYDTAHGTPSQASASVSIQALVTNNTKPGHGRKK